MTSPGRQKRILTRLFLVLFLILFTMLVIPSAFAQTGHITLLTVAESQDGSERSGGTADLFLDIRPGTGQIFLDTYPLTRLDTQSSTRYANQVACARVDAPCNNYDFFYTIRAGSSVVGGPSAGAAIAILTVAMLKGLELDDEVVITGTINSGGIVGPVAGEKEKAEAAARAGLKRVLISTFSYPSEVNESYLAFLNESAARGENVSVNLSLLRQPVDLSQIGVEIVQVSTLDEALRQFTGQDVFPSTNPLEEPPAYTAIMKAVARKLCDRRDELATSLAKNRSIENQSVVVTNETAHSEEALSAEDWYSAASYCFGDLIVMRGQAFEDLSQQDRKVIYAKLLKEISDYENRLGKRKLKTLAGLETYLIVSERLAAARLHLLDEDKNNLTAAGLGFAYERVYSAQVWSAFFRMESPAISLDDEHLRAACDTKLAESFERVSYAELYLPERYLDNAHEELKNAQADRNAGRYALCLFRAARGFADANLLAGTLSVPLDKVEALVDGKLGALEGVISRQSERGLFPVLGYSYFRYAQSLAPHDPYSALTFTEEALELSNLDLYFPRAKGFEFPEWTWFALLFLSGMALGVGIGLVVSRKTKKKSGEKGKKRSRGR